VLFCNAAILVKTLGNSSYLIVNNKIGGSAFNRGYTLKDEIIQ
jgi:hypothetical protein